jgi:uncharacterized protein YndB with AHSA1/START domain
MSQKDFTTTITVNESPEKVFDAVTNVRGWWSEEIEGGTSKLNDVFNYHFKDVHICRMKLSEVIPGKKVVWDVLDNYFQFTEDKHEWKGNKIVFDISKKGDQTELTFTQNGLIRDYECFEVCSKAWTKYITSSLKKLITGGKGEPNPKEGGFNEELIAKFNLQ